MKIGSLCTGYGGLELALGGDLAFVSEIDRHACALLETRFPGVPNLGDLTGLDTLPEVDVLTAGFPCQPVSQAGQRKGTDDERWLWDDIERLLGNMGRPPAVVFLENVRGLLTANGGDAMARVVEGLAGLGYVGSYRVVAAASVGACHRRERVFIRAAHAAHLGLERSGEPRGRGTGRRAGREEQLRQPERGQPEHPSGGHPDRSGLFGPYWPAVHRWERILGRPAPAPTDAGSARRREVTGSVRGDAAGSAGWTPDDDHESGGAGAEQDGSVTTDPGSSGRDRREATPAGIDNTDRPEDGRDEGSSVAQGRPGDAPRLNPRFVEWMMGLPDGWVCDLELPRTGKLKILGNGVVPQQARAAWELLGL